MKIIMLSMSKSIKGWVGGWGEPPDTALLCQPEQLDGVFSSSKDPVDDSPPILHEKHALIIN